MDGSLVPKLRRKVKQVVSQASGEDGPLERGDFTIKLARRQVSEAMGLGELGLEDQEWKDMVKQLVQEAVEKQGEAESSQAGSSSSSYSQGGSPPPHRDQPRSKSRGKALPSTSSKPKSKSKTEPRGKKGQSESSPKRAPIKGKGRKKEGSGSMSEVDVDVEDRSESEALENDQEGKEVQGAVEGHRTQSESEMSSVYDVPPTRVSGKKKKRKSGVDSDDEGQKTSSKKSAGSSGIKRKKKDPNEGLSPDEAKVADLKRIVVACGVRKQWGKELAGCDTPKDQIRHLEKLLIELGMKGKPSMGKAKTLKAQRELAAELNDVRKFEAVRGVTGAEAKTRRRSRAKKTDYGGQDVSDDEDDESSDGEAKEQSAMDAVLGFLGDDESD